MKQVKRILPVMLCFIMMFSLCACGTSEKRRTETGYVSETAAYQANNYAMYDYNEEAVAMESYGGFAPAPMPASGVAGNTAAKTDGNGSDTSKGDNSDDLNPEKIIYSGDATVETTEFDATVSALEAMIDSYGGWVETSSVNGAKYSSISRGSKTNRSASYTVRVPNEKFNGMMSELSSLGNIPYSHIYTENVTAQYYDTQARLQTYQAQEKRLMELLDKAETVSDVIEIENELTEVRYRIESLQTSLRGWDRRVSWSTIYLTINEVSEYTPTKTKTYGEKISEAFQYGIENLGEVFVGFVEALPVLLFLLVLLIALIAIIRAIFFNPKRREKRRARKEAKAAKKTEEQAKTE
ncbi:MAG: DUF4349 domain-containing protein [Oscillospiraceae bacterium]|nr:DUF4349 domain-containing protein [Oscillospiraceae bacterium]MBO7422923.1 DUF4349 domain-containing protein [Oscillospiraceae bacterium]MBP5169256.1 DUF4349 domain-containing protein [Oscillospiraceae bacterium]